MRGRLIISQSVIEPTWPPANADPPNIWAQRSLHPQTKNERDDKKYLSQLRNHCNWKADPPTPHSRWTALMMMDEKCDSSREMYGEAGKCSLSYDIPGRDLTRTEQFGATAALNFLWSLIALELIAQIVRRILFTIWKWGLLGWCSLNVTVLFLFKHQRIFWIRKTKVALTYFRGHEINAPHSMWGCLWNRRGNCNSCTKRLHNYWVALIGTILLLPVCGSDPGSP